MYLGRVVGCVWATVKNASLEGQRMLVIQPLTPELQNTGKRLVCLDCTGAGAGEIIYWVRGREASIALLPAEPPVDTTVVGIVDSIHLATGPQGGPTGAVGVSTAPQMAPTGAVGGPTAPQMVPTGAVGVPAGSQGVPTAPQMVPTGAVGGPTGSQMAPTGPNGTPAAGASRTPTHRKGRRC